MEQNASELAYLCSLNKIMIFLNYLLHSNARRKDAVSQGQ